MYINFLARKIETLRRKVPDFSSESYSSMSHDDLPGFPLKRGVYITAHFVVNFPRDPFTGEQDKKRRWLFLLKSLEVRVAAEFE